MEHSRGVVGCEQAVEGNLVSSLGLVTGRSRDRLTSSDSLRFEAVGTSVA
jgi:hypothetical protein